MKTFLNALLVKTNKSNQRGFTAIEIGVVLAIILIAAAVLIPILNGYFASSNVNNEVSAMRATLNDLDTRYSRENITAALNNEEIIASRIVSDSYRTSGVDIITNAFGNPIEIDGVDENGLTWETDIPEDVCGEFILATQTMSFDTVSVDGNDLGRLTDLTNSNVTAACTDTATDVNIVILSLIHISEPTRPY